MDRIADGKGRKKRTVIDGRGQCDMVSKRENEGASKLEMEQQFSMCALCDKLVKLFH